MVQTSPLLVFLSAVTVALVVVQFVPQARKAVRGDVAGIAPTTFWLQLASSVVWVSYAASTGTIGVFAAHSIAGFCALVVLLAIRHYKHLNWIGATLPALALVAVVTLGLDFVVPVAAVAFAFAAAPQLVAVLRQADLSGVSLTSWLLSVVAGVAWIFYGIALGDWKVWIPVWIPLLCATIIAVRVILWQRKSRVSAGGL